MRKSVTGFILLIQAAIGMAADVEITYSKEPGDVFQASKRIVCAAGFKTPPTIDGKLDDAQWQATPLQTDFTLIGSNAATKEKTEFKIGYDEKNIFIAIICHESEMAKISVSALPEPNKVDKDIENQDVIHVLLAGPINRQNKYYDICINAAGEYSDTFMDWKPGKIGWFYRGGNLKDMQIKTSRDSDHWMVEMSIPFASLEGWGTALFSQPWNFQVVRMERPHQEISSWNPLTKYPCGPEQFGMLNLNEKVYPVFIEHAQALRVKDDLFLTRVLVRKINPEPLTVDLRVSSNEARNFSLTAPVTTVFLPRKFQQSEIKKYNEYGFSNSIDFHIYSRYAGETGTGKFIFIYDPAFKKADDSKLTMPGINDKNKESDELFFYPVRLKLTSIPKGENMVASFDLPVGDCEKADSRIELSILDQQGKVLKKTEFTPTELRGEISIPIAALPLGNYTLKCDILVNNKLSCDFLSKFTIVENLF